jgi:hypothetical protein
MFESCTSLESIKIPESITSIGNWAFYDCKDAEIIFKGAEDQWNNITKGPYWNTNGTKKITFEKTQDIAQG